MPIKVTCPKCQGVLHAPDDAGGKRGKCPTCGTVLSIPEDPMRATAAAPTRAAGDPFDPSGSAGLGGSLPTRGSGLGGIPDAPSPAPARGVPPPAFGGAPSPQRLPDPFARPGKKPARAGEPSDGLVRAWKRTRRGLWWVGLGLFLFLLVPLSIAGFGIAEKFGVKLPSQTPGYLQLANFSSEAEIRWGAVLIPTVLGSLALLLGRFGVSNAPRSSYARGLALAAALATLIAVLGAISYAVPTAMQVKEGFAPESLLPVDDITGILQRVGLCALAVLLPLAELWFIVALGRMGAALHNDRLAGRGTRFLLYLGLIGILAAAYVFATSTYPSEVRTFVNEYIQPQWDKLGEHKVTAGFGLLGFVGLVVWFWNIRLVTGARRAIREWQEQNEPGA